MKRSLSLLNILAVAFVAVLAPITLATPFITGVVETGGVNEATDTIVAQFTGLTFVNGVANEPINGKGASDPYTVGVFGNHAPTFVDRNHRYTNASATVLLPAYLVGGEYIMSGNDNRDRPTYRLDVTVSSQVNVYMLIDNRLGGNGEDPPTFGAATMQWILDEGWMPVISGTNRFGTNVPDEVGIDESADGTINQWFSVYKRVFPPGTFTLRQPDNAGQNMYGVVVTLGVDPTNLPPAVVNLSPANNASFHAVSNGVSFNLTTLPPNTIATQSIRLTLNGTDVSTSLVVTGDATNRAVRFSGLASNTIYSGRIVAADTAGRGVTNNFAFDTFVRSGVILVEAEDYNYGDGDCTTPSSPLDSAFGGLFIDNPAPGAYAMIPGGPAVGTVDADYHDNGTTRGSTNSYRPCDYVGTIRSGDVLHPPFTNGGFPNFDIAQAQTNEWWNYTRTVAAGNYAVYLRVQSGAAQSVRLDKASGDLSLPDQTITPVGTFLVPNTGSAYSYVRLTDALGSPAVVNFTGGPATVRLTALNANNNLQANFFMLVRASASVAPSVASVSPQPNAVAVPRETIVTATLVNGTTAVNPGSIVLRFNGSNVTTSAAISNTAQGITVTYDPPGLLATNTTYTVSIQFSDNGAPAASFTNTWSFTTIPGTPFVTKASQGTANHWGNTIWSNPPSSVATAPLAGEKYEAVANGVLYGNATANTRLRNPASGSGDAVIGVKTFPGDSLTLNAGTDIRSKGVGNILDFPGVGGNPGLILNGGALNPGDTGAFGLTGRVLVASASLFAMGDNGLGGVLDRSWQVSASLSGAGALIILQGPTTLPAVDVLSSGNTFSGNWVVKAGYLKGTGSNSLGTGNIIVDGSFAVPSGLIDPATVLSNGPAWFEVNYDLDTRGTLTLGNNAQMILHQNISVGGLTINGTNVPNGTYTYAQLVASYPSSFAAGGSGSIAVNGSIPIVGIGIPTNRAVRSALTSAGGSLRGEYWKRPVWSIATDGTTVASNRVDEQIKRFGSPSGTFSARSFVYLGNDLTPVTNWLGADGASFVGATTNLDDAAFRFTGFVNITNPGTVLNIGLNSDDGSRIRIGGIDIVDNDGGHGDQTRDTNITFTAAGLYPIEITYFNGDWTSDNGPGGVPVNHSGNPDPGVHGGANFRLLLNGTNITAAGTSILHPPSALGPPANIIWVSFHAGDTNPSAAAATAGFTQAPDVGYTELLRSYGHSVTRVLSSDIPNTNVLNAADLVIISRSVPSGHYELDAETAAWNSISTPTIVLGGYVIRQNRLGYMAGTTIPDVNSVSVRLAVTNTHPIFAGIGLDTSNTMVNPYAHRVTYTNNLQAGISVVTGATAPGGMVLARIGTPGDAALGGMAIGEWPAGAIMATAPPDTLGGRRLVFLTGSREIGGLTSEGSGIYDLDPDGAQMFINAVRYMARPAAVAGQPPYVAAVLADGPIAYYRFNESGTVATNSGTGGGALNGMYVGGAISGTEAPRPPSLIGFETNNTALQLNGTNAYVTTISGLLNGRTNFTISGWIRRNGAQANRTGLWGQNDIIEFGYIDNNTLQLWTDNGLNLTPNPFPDGQWAHVAIVGEGSPGTARLYTNGMLAGTRTHTLPTNNVFPFNIGGGGIFDTITNAAGAPTGNYFNGQIDEVAVFDKALSGAQIATHYFSTIGSPPVITRQPAGTNTFEGANIVLSVGVAGPGPFFYQWLDFGSPIPGQTNATLVFSNASVIQSSTYSVIVSNAFGSVTSADADVLIQAQQPPTITQQPQSITKYAGANATLSVVASGGVNLRYQWQRSSTNVVGATNASLVFPSVQAANAGSYRVIVQNSSGSITSQVATITVITPAAGSYEEGIAALSPIAFWRFNETSGTIAFDSFGNNHATYTNTATNGIVAPRPPQFPGFEAGNRAATFDGVSGFVQGPSGLLNGLSNFTMAGWIRRETNQANRTGLFGQNDIVEFGYIDNNTLQLWTDGGLNVTPNPFPNGAWSHVAVVAQGTPGGTARMYTNGVLAATRTHTLPAANQFTFNVGGGGIFDTTGNFFNGQVDELAVFNKALTAAEITQLYTKAVGQAAQISIAIMRDNIIEDSKPTGPRYEGANFGANWQVRSNYDGVSITRTGVMQFVSTELDQITLAPNTNFNSSAGTIMFWMRSTGTVTTAGDFGAMLFDRRPTNPGGPPGDVIVQTDAGHIFVQAASGSGGVNSFEGTRTVSDNRWHHIAYTYNQAAGGATTVYVDGTLDRSQTNSAPWSWTPTQRIELGRSHDPYWRIYNGFLDDFRIYNRVLTPAEIAQVANTDALVDTAALQVRFNFSAPPTGVMLTWPGGGVLQRTGGIGPAAVWTDLSNAVSPVILDTRGASNAFFRVRQ